MRIKVYVLDLELSRKTRRVALLVGLPLAMLLGAGAVVYAGVPNTFAPGQPLSSMAMNQNFASLDQRIATLEAFRAQATAKGAYSLGATYCGATAAVPGNFTLPAGKSMCVTACTQPTAHMCTGEELTRSVSLGINPPTSMLNTPGGWIASGVAATATDHMSNTDDCGGWVSAGSDYGSTWFNGTVIGMGFNGPAGAVCSMANPIYCCN